MRFCLAGGAVLKRPMRPKYLENVAWLEPRSLHDAAASYAESLKVSRGPATGGIQLKERQFVARRRRGSLVLTPAKT